MKRFLTILLLLATFPLRAASFESAEREIERSMKSGGVPGVALVAASFAEGVRVCSVERRPPLFRLGSTTKLFVALAALRLVDQGALRLDGPIGDVVPGLAPALGAVTLEQLLTHTAGLAEDAPQTGPLDESAPGAGHRLDRRGALRLSRRGLLVREPRVRPRRRRDRPGGQAALSAAIRSLVLEPAGMAESTFRPLEAFTRPVALGHDKAGIIRPIAEHAGNYPPGSLFTNVEELGRFLSSLPAETLERLGKARVAIPAQGRSYGYGLIRDERRGARVLLHAGARSGYGSTFLFLPDQRAAVAILANRTGATMSSAAFAAARELAELKEPEVPAGVVELSPELRAGVTGTYANGTFLPAVELVEDGGHLVIRVGGKAFPAECVGNDRFRAKGAGQLESFIIVRDARGQARFLCAETWALRKRS
ncbi:MAG: beta-lactamase family protein [Holophagales bacterium]|nr:beta-lactamase family protein [Holophagales bacterium]